jgi:hypothetical protein
VLWATVQILVLYYGPQHKIRFESDTNQMLWSWSLGCKEPKHSVGTGGGAAIKFWLPLWLLAPASAQGHTQESQS